MTEGPEPGRGRRGAAPAGDEVLDIAGVDPDRAGAEEEGSAPAAAALGAHLHAAALRRALEGAGDVVPASLEAFLS